MEYKSKIHALKAKLARKAVSSPVSSPTAVNSSRFSGSNPPISADFPFLHRAEDILRDEIRGFAPPKVLSVSEWADEHLYLSPEYAAEPGKWKTLPFQREVFDAVSDPSVRQVVARTCTQLLKTSLIQAAIGWVIDVDPGPILVVQPRDADAKSFSKERIAPMLRDTPRLHDKVSESKSRSADNTIEEKWFRGGMLAITSAGSPGNLARRAIRYLFCDEEDKWAISAGVEGKPFFLALKRTATFRHRAKAIRCCSPTRVGSAIDMAYEASDQREYHVPCPACGEFQAMTGKFHSNVVWDNSLPTFEARAATAKYRCEYCDTLWTESERQAAVTLGKWVANKPHNGVAGFWISELYSPWKTLREIVLDFLQKSRNTEELITFVNTSLAENWRDKGEALEWERLLDRREDYPVGSIPPGVLFLTAGVDIQKDRIEAEVVGWGRNNESWSIQYEILEGPTNEPGVWAQLDNLLAKTYDTPSGNQIGISRAFVDSSGLTNDVYRWARNKPPQQVGLIKGDDRSDLLVGQPSAVETTVNGKKIKTGLHLRRVKVSSFKQELYSWLSQRCPTSEEIAAGEKYPFGYCHFPTGKNYGDTHFKQLCAEQLVQIRNPRTGAVRYMWQPITPNARNEALDARIYARAAAWDMGMDRAQDSHWRRLELQVHGAAPPPSSPPQTSNSLSPSHSSSSSSSSTSSRHQDPPLQPSSVREYTQDIGRRVRRSNWIGGI